MVFLAPLDLAPFGLQKCYTPKSTSTINIQLIQMITNVELQITNLIYLSSKNFHLATVLNLLVKFQIKLGTPKP